MHEVTDTIVAGVRSAVFDSDPGGSAEAIVFVHGNPGPMDDWESLVPPASALARVIAPDMPGYGRADHPRTFDFSIDGYGRHLGGILEQRGIARAHLVLHDFGGPWGLWWASQNPAKVASVTLINTSNLKDYRWHKFAKIWQTPVLGELFQLTGTRKILKMALDQDNPKPIPWAVVDRVMGYADWNHKMAVLKLYRATKDPQPWAVEIETKMRPLDRPCLVVWGAEDPYLPKSMAPKMRECFPSAEVHVLDGLGHWPFVDDPKQIRSLVLPFLKKQVGASAEAPAVA